MFFFCGAARNSSTRTGTITSTVSAVSAVIVRWQTSPSPARMRPCSAMTATVMSSPPNVSPATRSSCQVRVDGRAFWDLKLYFQINNRHQGIFLYNVFYSKILICNKWSKSASAMSLFPSYFFPVICVPSVRYEEVGVCGFDVARRLLHLSQLWTAHWLQVFHPWQGRTLLCGLLWRQVCPSVHPL